MLAGMWVKTIVLSRPMRCATSGAANCDSALNRPAQKKNAPACASDRPKRCSSHSDSKALTIRPPANASTQNSAASLTTMARDAASGALAAGALSDECSGTRRYKSHTATPIAPYKPNSARNASSRARPACTLSQSGSAAASAPTAAHSAPSTL